MQCNMRTTVKTGIARATAGRICAPRMPIRSNEPPVLKRDIAKAAGTPTISESVVATAPIDRLFHRYLING